MLGKKRGNYGSRERHREREIVRMLKLKGHRNRGKADETGRSGVGENREAAEEERHIEIRRETRGTSYGKTFALAIA